jgi:hypothetical protein
MNAKIVGLERFWRIFRLLFHWFGLFFHGCRYYTRTAPGIHLLRTFFTQRYLCTEKVQRRYGASTVQVRCKGISDTVQRHSFSRIVS